MKRISLVYIFAMLTLTTCQKKDLDLKLVESACKNFKISSPTKVWIADPSCTGSPLTASMSVSFNYNGDDNCLDHIELAPRFYKDDNSLISNVSYNGILKKDDPLVSINTNTNSVTFTFQFTFANAAEADALNYVYLKFHVENELGDESNKLELRANGSCFTLNSNTYTVKSTVSVPSSSVAVTLYDDAAEDGDIVSVYLNGVCVLENYTLTNAGHTFNWTVNSGNNHLVLFAVNEGSSGPNTCAISINGGTHISLSPDLLTGQAINIQF